MKINKNACRLLIIFFAILLCLNVNAQKNIFIRLYGANGGKLGKGNLLAGNDSLIEVLRGKKKDTFLVSKVNLLKTKRVFGHSVLIGTGIGVGLGTIGIIAASTGDNNNEGSSWSFGVALGSVAAPYVGAATGAVVGAVTKRTTFEIKGDPENWKAARNKLLPVQ